MKDCYFSPRGVSMRSLILLYMEVHTYSCKRIVHELEFQILSITQILPKGNICRKLLNINEYL